MWLALDYVTVAAMSRTPFAFWSHGWLSQRRVGKQRKHRWKAHWSVLKIWSFLSDTTSSFRDNNLDYPKQRFSSFRNSDIWSSLPLWHPLCAVFLLELIKMNCASRPSATLKSWLRYCGVGGSSLPTSPGCVLSGIPPVHSQISHTHPRVSMSVRSLYKMAFVLNRNLCISESHLGGMRLAFYLETSVDSAFPWGIILVVKCEAGGSNGIKMSLSMLLKQLCWRSCALAQW